MEASQLADATTTLMQNLVSQKTVFFTAFEGDAIYEDLESYLPAFRVRKCSLRP